MTLNFVVEDSTIVMFVLAFVSAVAFVILILSNISSDLRMRLCLSAGIAFFTFTVFGSVQAYSSSGDVVYLNHLDEMNSTIDICTANTSSRSVIYLDNQNRVKEASYHPARGVDFQGAENAEGEQLEDCRDVIVGP